MAKQPEQIGERVAVLEEGVRGIRDGINEMRTNHLPHIEQAMIAHNAEDKARHNEIMKQLSELDGWRWKVVGASGVIMAVVSVLGSALASKLIHP